MLPHFLRLVFGIEDGQLSEHSHVSTLQAEGRLQQSCNSSSLFIHRSSIPPLTNEFLEMSPVLVEVVELLEFVRMHHDVQATHLRQTEFLVLHARKAHLQPRDLITHPSSMGTSYIRIGQKCAPKVKTENTQ